MAGPGFPSQPSVEGDGAIAAGRPLLGAPEVGRVGFKGCGRGKSIMDNWGNW